MLSRLWRFIESVLYAGLKPRTPGQASEEKQSGLFRTLWAPVERFVSGGVAPSDPLYLSNRTWGQKLKLALVVTIPGLLLAGALALGFSNVFTPKTAPPREPTPEEVNAKLLPDLEKHVAIGTFKDAEITEVSVDRAGAPSIKGVLKNNTNHVLSVEFTADLADGLGSRVGAIRERVLNTAPRSSTPFQFPLTTPTAGYVIVRELHAVEAR